MKILLLGDASNYHHSLSVGLAKLGHDVTLASHGSGWMDTARNIDISRRPGRIGGALHWLQMQRLANSQLKGFDIVQISNPVFLSLKPHRVKAIFDKVKANNGSIFLTALGTDSAYAKLCQRAVHEGALRYTEWLAGGEPTPHWHSHHEIFDAWLQTPLLDHCEYVYENVCGAVSALYEYHLAMMSAMPMDKLAYGGIPIDMDLHKGHALDVNGALKIMVACHKGRETEKGIDILLPQIQEFAAAHPQEVKVDFVQNVPFAQFKSILDNADIVVDQLYAYSPSTTPLMAMAKGKLCVTGGEEDFYRFIGEKKLRPIINPDPLRPEVLRQQLEKLLANKELRRKKSLEGVEFVAKHNADIVVAQRFVDFWGRRAK